MSRSTPRRIVVVVVSWLVEYAIALGMWFLFVAKFSVHELIVGGIAAVIAATASSIVRTQHLAELGPYARDFAQIWRVPKGLLVDTWVVLCVLARHVTGRGEAPSLFLSVPFEPISDDPRDATRRALATAYSSITPNMIVLGVDREHARLIFHQIRRAPIPELTKRLGARP